MTVTGQMGCRSIPGIHEQRLEVLRQQAVDGVEPLCPVRTGHADVAPLCARCQRAVRAARYRERAEKGNGPIRLW